MRRFARGALKKGKMREDVRAKVFELMDRQLESSVEDIEDRLAIRTRIRGGSRVFRGGVLQSFHSGVFLLPDQPEDDGVRGTRHICN